jgi:TolB protein
LSAETVACHFVDHPLLSGGQVVFRIYIMGGDGREAREIAEGREVDWSPDGQKLVCVGRDYRSLHVVSLPNGEISLLADFDNLIYDPAWAPDGERIAFHMLDDNIWVIDADGSNLEQLTQREPRNDVCLGPPSWSPDATRIAFSMSPNCRTEEETRSDIYIVNSDGSNVTRVTDGMGNYWNPVWSPREDRIVFNEYRDGQSSIYVMNADGSEQTRLATGRPYAWSPDGARVYYHQLGSSVVWTMSSTDGSHQRAVFTLNCDEPAWSPVVEAEETID